jgi:DNA-nicking Smr family endonuclease
MSRRLSESDRALWSAVQESITPLAERRRVLPRAAAAAVREVTKPVPAAPEKRAEVDLSGLKIGGGLKPALPHAHRAPFTAGLDKRQEQRLKRGQLPIEARLDLHGLTQGAAQAAALAFVARGIETGARCLLIITGKGGAQGGVLRRALPHWLEASGHARDILRLVPAAIQHGGEGAFYVLLKRKRERA